MFTISKQTVFSLALAGGLLASGVNVARADATQGAEQGSAALSSPRGPLSGARTEVRFETGSSLDRQLRADPTAGAERGSAALTTRLSGPAGQANMGSHWPRPTNPTAGAERGTANW